MPSSLSSPSIPPSIIEALEKEAGRRGVAPEAVLVELLAKLLPEEERWRAYLEAAETSTGHAEKELEEGNYVEAYRRIWTAVLLAITGYSLRRRGVEPGTMDDYWESVEEMGEEAGEIYAAWYAGLAARLLVEEEKGYPGHAKAMISLVRQAVERIEEALGQ